MQPVQPYSQPPGQVPPAPGLPLSSPPPTPRWFKGILGCAIGCGALAVLAVIGGAIALWWFLSPGKQHTTAAIIAPGGDGAFRVGDLGADPGVTGLLDRFLLETQRQQQQGMPPWLRQMQQMGSAASSPSAGLRMFLPKQATISIEPPEEEGGEPGFVAAVNPRGMTRMLRPLLAQEQTGSHQGKEIYRLGATGSAAFVDGTLLLASDETAVRAGIDRLLQGGEAPEPPQPDLGAPTREWDLTGVVTNRDGALERMLWRDRAAPAGLRQASLGIDVATSDLTTGRILVDCESAEAAAATVEALVERAGEKALELGEDGLELRTASRVEGTRAILEWEVHGFERAIEQLVAESNQNQRSDG